MAKQPLRLDDRRRSGAGDNVPYTVKETGNYNPDFDALSPIFNDRSKKKAPKSKLGGTKVRLGVGKRIA